MSNVTLRSAIGRGWNSPWVGAVVLNPLGFTLPWVALSLLFAVLPGNAPEYIVWGFAAILLGALAGAVRTAISAARCGLPEGLALLTAGLTVSGAAGFAAIWAWFRIADMTCAERSVCFFT